MHSENNTHGSFQAEYRPHTSMVLCLNFSPATPPLQVWQKDGSLVHPTCKHAFLHLPISSLRNKQALPYTLVRSILNPPQTAAMHPPFVALQAVLWSLEDAFGQSGYPW